MHWTESGCVGTHWNVLNGAAMYWNVSDCTVVRENCSGKCWVVLGCIDADWKQWCVLACIGSCWCVLCWAALVRIGTCWNVLGCSLNMLVYGAMSCDLFGCVGLD